MVDCGVREGRAVVAGKDWMDLEVRESRAFHVLNGNYTNEKRIKSLNGARERN